MGNCQGGKRVEAPHAPFYCSLYWMFNEFPVSSTIFHSSKIKQSRQTGWRHTPAHSTPPKNHSILTHTSSTKQPANLDFRSSKKCHAAQPEGFESVRPGRRGGLWAGPDRCPADAPAMNLGIRPPKEGSIKDPRPQNALPTRPVTHLLNSAKGT